MNYEEMQHHDHVHIPFAEFERLTRDSQELHEERNMQMREAARRKAMRDKTQQWYYSNIKHCKTRCQKEILRYLSKATRPHGDFVSAKIETIAKKIKYSQRHVKSSMKQLQDAINVVYIEHRRNPNTGKNGISRYWPYYEKSRIEGRKFQQEQQKQAYQKPASETLENNSFQGEVQGAASAPQLYRSISIPKSKSSTQASITPSTHANSQPISETNKGPIQESKVSQERSGPAPHTMPCDGVTGHKEIHPSGQEKNTEQGRAVQDSPVSADNCFRLSEEEPLTRNGDTQSGRSEIPRQEKQRESVFSDDVFWYN